MRVIPRSARETCPLEQVLERGRWLRGDSLAQLFEVEGSFDDFALGSYHLHGG
jgi:hypothetical protein